jgi:hypothetical protein
VSTKSQLVALALFLWGAVLLVQAIRRRAAAFERETA